MAGKTIQEWYVTSSIDWVAYWCLIDDLDAIVKRHRKPGMRSRDNIRPSLQYNAPALFRSRFNQDGNVARSYGEIEKLMFPKGNVGATFVRGIIETMLHRMNHPARRIQWNRVESNKPVLRILSAV